MSPKVCLYKEELQRRVKLHRAFSDQAVSVKSTQGCVDASCPWASGVKEHAEFP